MKPLLHRFLSESRGAVAVEFAIVSLVFIIFCIGLIDFGRNVDAQGRLGHAADAAARVLFLNKTATEAQVATRIAASFPALGFDRMTLKLTDQTYGGKAFKRISVSLPLRFMTPGFTSRSGTVTVQRLVPVS